MALTSNEETAIIRTERGLTIAGTRITLYLEMLQRWLILYPIRVMVKRAVYWKFLMRSVNLSQ